VLPTVEMYVPAEHEVHVAQLVSSVAVLKVPLAQAAQVRFVVALPLTETYVPAAQSVHGTHAVAELLSLSHVPWPHVT
jgi:hypothetical protein